MSPSNQDCERRLNDALAEVDRLREQLAVAREGFGLCVFSPVCDHIGALHSHKTSDSLAAALGVLAGHLATKVGHDSCLAAFKHLASFLIDDRSGRLTPSDNPAVAGAFECLRILSFKIPPKSSQFEACLAEIRRLLAHPQLRTECVKVLLVHLLNRYPDIDALQTLFLEQLECTPSTIGAGDQGAFHVALNNICSLSEVDVEFIATCFHRAFPGSPEAWLLFGENYRIQLHRAFTERYEEDRALQPGHLEAILHSAQNYVLEQEPALFQLARSREYEFVTRIISLIHYQQGNPRPWRPPNRHVVLRDTIQATIEIPAPHSCGATGRVVNFGLGDHRFHGGAWIVGNQGLGWPDKGPWRAARVTFEHRALGQPLTFEASVMGPFDCAGQFGFRVTWGLTPADLQMALEPLRRLYPLMR